MQRRNKKEIKPKWIVKIENEYLRLDLANEYERKTKNNVQR